MSIQIDAILISSEGGESILKVLIRKGHLLR